MEQFRAFLRRKNIVFSAKRYGVDALGAMAQGLFCTLLVGTILNTLGTQFHIGFLSATVVTVGTGEAATAYTIGGLASAMVGPAMAVAIGSALQAPALVLFSLVPVGYATNILGGAGGPLAVLVIAIVAAECGKAVSKETKVDILVTPIVTVLVGIGVAYLVAPPIGTAASWVGNLIMWATELQPFFMGIDRVGVPHPHHSPVRDQGEEQGSRLPPAGRVMGGKAVLLQASHRGRPLAGVKPSLNLLHVVGGIPQADLPSPEALFQFIAFHGSPPYRPPTPPDGPGKTRPRSASPAVPAKGGGRGAGHPNHKPRPL